MAMVYNAPLLFFFLCSINLFANIHFTSDLLIFQLPNTVVASGNTSFKYQDITLTSRQFTYDTHQQSGFFEHQVDVQTKNSRLTGDYFSLDAVEKKIIGKGNIKFKSNSISAQSDHLIIENFEHLILKDNVIILKNNSQIRTNELVYNLKTDTILSNKRVKLIINEP